MATNTWTVSKQYMADTGTFGGGAANPGDSHIPIGKWDPGTGLSWITRACLYAPVSFSGMTSINSARLYFYTHTASGWHANGTGTKGYSVRRKTADWSETSAGASSAIDEIWGGDGSSIVMSNFVNAGDVTTNISTDTADGTLVYMDITETVQDWFSGSANYGVMVFAVTSETSSADAIEFYSRHVTGKKPYIWIDYNTNTAPNAPVSLAPTGNEIRHTGTSVVCSGTRSDPDSGDYITAYQIVLYKDDGTTLVQDSGKITVTGNPTTFARTMSIGSNGANKFYKWKARTWDKANVVGAYSALQRFKANTVPNGVSSMSVETDTLTPTLSGSMSDPDAGDSLTQVQIEVYRTSDNVTMWSSGDLAVSGTSFAKVYAGTALAWSTEYKWRARCKDSNGAYSSWSSYVSWTTSQPVGPTQSPRTTTAGVAWGGKINDTTPDLTLTYSENFTDHEIFVYSDANGTNLVFSDLPTAYTATTSKVVTCTTVLTNGATYYWKARVFIQSSSTWSDWAGEGGGAQEGQITSAFYINALPTATSTANITARDNPGEAIRTRDTDGVLIVLDRIPCLEAEFADPDIGTYGDTPSARSIEIYDNGTNTLVHSDENLAPANTIPMRYFPGTVSGANTTLAAAAVPGATNIKVTAVTSMAVGDKLRLGPEGLTQEVVTITTVGTAGSGGTGIDFTPPLTYDHANAEAVVELVPVLNNETTYKMRWRFQDNSDTYGAWSSYVVFKVTEASSVSTLAPSGTLTSPAFTATWNHTSPSSKAQGKYRLTITKTSTSEIVYDTGMVVSSTESHVVPGGFLVNGTAYTLGVEVFDTDNV